MTSNVQACPTGDYPIMRENAADDKGDPPPNSYASPEESVQGRSLRLTALGAVLILFGLVILILNIAGLVINNSYFFWAGITIGLWIIIGGILYMVADHSQDPILLLVTIVFTMSMLGTICLPIEEYFFLIGIMETGKITEADETLFGLYIAILVFILLDFIFAIVTAVVASKLLLVKLIAAMQGPPMTSPSTGTHALHEESGCGDFPRLRDFGVVLMLSGLLILILDITGLVISACQIPWSTITFELLIIIGGMVCMVAGHSQDTILSTVTLVFTTSICGTIWWPISLYIDIIDNSSAYDIPEAQQGTLLGLLKAILAFTLLAFVLAIHIALVARKLLHLRFNAAIHGPPMMSQTTGPNAPHASSQFS